MKKILFFGLLLFLVQINATAQNEKFKALFMYNFTKYLEWPEGDRQGDFIITIVGNSPIIDELQIISQKKKVGFQPIVVKKATEPGQISKSHIIFITEQKSSYIDDIKGRFSATSTVIITDKPGSISKGAGINYVVQGGKQLFEICEENLREHNVKVGSDLLSLGIKK